MALHFRLNIPMNGERIHFIGRGYLKRKRRFQKKLNLLFYHVYPIWILFNMKYAMKFNDYFLKIKITIDD